MKKIYLAGPMRGIPEFNFPAFHAAAAKLRAEGHEVFNPAEADNKEFGVDVSTGNNTGCENEAAKRVGMTGLELARNCFLRDTNWICRHADAIALLPGWENSRGATAERALALAIGLEIIHV